ncbi:Uncharacterised protein r2_g539 [Pycnogonum litorale]
MAAKFSPPKEFDFDPANWSEWFGRWQRYRTISKFSVDDAQLQIDSFLYCMGSKSESIFNGLGLSDTDSKVYDKVTDAFTKYFSPRKYVIYERARFFRRDQRAGETVEQFIRALNDVADRCDFSNRSEQMRDRIVVGITDVACSREMQKMDVDKLTEGVAVNMARQSEQVDKHIKELTEFHKPSPTLVDAVSQRGNKQSNVQLRNSSPSSSNPCDRCGYSVHTSGSCPAKHAKCKKCLKTGHYGKVCRSTSKGDGKVHELEEDLENVFLGDVDVKNNVAWTKTVKVDKLTVPVRFKLDTGADVSIIPSRLCKSIRLDRADKRLVGPGNTRIPVLGYFTAKLTVNNVSHDENLYVVDQTKALLGRVACVKLGLITCDCHIDAVCDSNVGSVFQKEFPKLFLGLGKMKQEVGIELRSECRPFAINTPRSVPYPLLSSVKCELDDMVSKGVIFPVREPTDWCAPMVVVPKSNQRVRICVDYTELNKGVKREVFPMAHVESSLAKLGNGSIFTVLDANSGFYQIPLSDASKRLTTFLSPFGRFAFNRLPFGLSSSPELYSKIVSRILDGLEGVICHMDDVCIWGTNAEEHDSRVRAVLKRMVAAGMTLNVDKCKFSRSSIRFLGNIISSSGIRANPDAVQGIKDFVTPRNVKDVRSFLGMANQLGKFSSKLGQLSAPLRELLHKNTFWFWDIAQEQAFSEIKTELQRSVELASYSPLRDTVIHTDASRSGIGAALLQVQDDGELRLVCAASRSLSDTEKRYATIEQEALGVVWACEKFKDYIIGLQVTIKTDHKPLIPLLNDIELGKMPARIQRFRMRLMRFNYKVEHISGSANVIADALSRSCGQLTQSDVAFMEQVELYAVSALYQTASSPRQEELKLQQGQDEVLSRVMNFVKHGWPTYLPSHDVLLRPFFETRSRLSVVNELLVLDDRIVIPQVERLAVLDKIHSGHLGVTKCRARAAQSVWWPGMSQQIAEMARRCEPCRKYANVQESPLLRSVFPDRPWSKLGSDLFYFDSKWYLLIVDYHSRFIEVSLLPDITSSGVINCMKSIFARHGIPDLVVSDNGPQYASEEFASFAKTYSFTHITSSPRHPQGNGAAERAVQTVKNILRKGLDPYLGLMAYRSSPLENGLSPAELLMGRKLRTTIPTLPVVLTPESPDLVQVKLKESIMRGLSEDNFDTRHRAIETPPLSPGDPVYVRDLKRDAVVVGSSPERPRSYLVKDTQGSTVRRNKLNLAPLPNPEADQDIPSSGGDGTPIKISRFGRVIKPPSKLDM